MRTFAWAGLALAAALATGPAAEAGAGKKKEKVKGTVAAVQAAEAGGGTITVRLLPGKADAETKDKAAPAEKTFQVNAKTEVVKVEGAKDDRKTVPATFADLKAGSRVVVASKGGAVATVTIQPGKKKGKKG